MRIMAPEWMKNQHQQQYSVRASWLTLKRRAINDLRVS
ncbi:hypothetical protein CSC17_4477 [Klebsiella oxytoca]|nr:hypothetical protein CSC17_4477 [Klebsiella oxytoca]